MFEKCITHVQVGLCPGLNSGQPTSQTIRPYVGQSMTTCSDGYVVFFVNFKGQLSLIFNLNLIDCFTMNNDLIQRIIPAICKMIALTIFPSSTNQTFSQSSNESAQPLWKIPSQDVRQFISFPLESYF